MEHESEVFFPSVIWTRSGQVDCVLDEFEANGKLTATEVGLLESLPPARAALEHFEVFADSLRFG
jgi:hypothetical protein